MSILKKLVKEVDLKRIRINTQQEENKHLL